MTSLWNYFFRSNDKNAHAHGLANEQVAGSIDAYNNYFTDGKEAEKCGSRKDEAQSLVNLYYNLVTDFYEYGWGQSFHFAARFKGETMNESIVRHEYYLASKLQLKPGQKIIDCGCGIGGPLRNIARFSGANITGVTINDYQVQRARKLNEQQQLQRLATVVRGDFMNLTATFEPNSFDHAYEIEATCHAPDRVACFEQILKVVKPGGYFGGYEWGMTDKYDPDNEQHVAIKYGIEKGNGIPDLIPNREIIAALRTAGWEVLEVSDIAEDWKQRGFQVGWYETLRAGYTSLDAIRHTKFGRFLTHQMCQVFEFLGVAPKGTVSTHSMLTKTADALAEGGHLGIFTPMLFFLARKPAKL